MRNAFSILVGTIKWKRSIRGRMFRLDDNIKVYLKQDMRS